MWSHLAPPPAPPPLPHPHQTTSEQRWQSPTGGGGGWPLRISLWFIEMHRLQSVDRVRKNYHLALTADGMQVE